MMGSRKDDDFSSKTNLNMNGHSQTMQYLDSNYVEPNLNMPLPSNSAPNIMVEKT